MEFTDVSNTQNIDTKQFPVTFGHFQHENHYIT